VAGVNDAMGVSALFSTGWRRISPQCLACGSGC
jgi:hypothetical protein